MNADLVFTILGLTALTRGLFGNFARSWDRMRSFFEQSLLRFAWLALAAIFGLSATTRPDVSPPDLQVADAAIAGFLLVCALLIELASLMFYRACFKQGELRCRNEHFGELIVEPEAVQLVFAMRTGPEGLSDNAFLVPVRRGIPSPIPKILVYQVLIRTAQPHPLKYLVVMETLRRSASRAEAARLAKRLGVPLLEDGQFQGGQSQGGESISKASVSE